tara:strand:+ start:461 stop:1555 length:1095 start_codon:yes stop_codon:yes gene_type:complete
MRLFISYSHKDEQYKDQLETQLSILKRKNVVSSWYDRKITAGQEWKGEIDNNLEETEIVLLLVSPDFLASDYCYEKEMGRAIERHDIKDAIVIPVILRPCDWHETPFSKLQALPKDAKAISTWEDIDEAWLDVVLGLKKSIYAAGEKKKKVIQKEIWTNHVGDNFFLWLNDTEIELSHRRVSKVILDNVYVVPDLKVLDEDMDRVSKSVSANHVLEKKNASLVFGDEQSGKTSLCKYYFKELIKRGYFPLYIQGSDVKSADSAMLISNVSKEQYSSEFDYQDAKHKVLIIDNFSNNKLNKKYQNKFVEKIKNEFEKIIIFAIDSFQYVSHEIEELNDFECYEILNFGNVKRTELIEKWITLGCI